MEQDSGDSAGTLVEEIVWIWLERWKDIDENKSVESGILSPFLYFMAYILQVIL